MKIAVTGVEHLRVGHTLTIANTDFKEKTGMPTKQFKVTEIHDNGDISLEPHKPFTPFKVNP